MATRFIGRFEHSLDTKGRVVLPARFRASFELLAYVSQYTDGCLAVWTPEEFDRQVESVRSRQDLSAADRNLARIWSGGSVDVEIDRQGRLAIPPYLREFAQLESAVLVMGAIDRVELWNPAAWEERVKPAEVALVHPPDATVGA